MYIKANCRLAVYAEQNLWYWRGTGRTNDTINLVDRPGPVVGDVLEKEMLFNDFIDNTTNRTQWATAPSVYGPQPQFRTWLKNYTLNTGTASYQNPEGQEVLFDLTKKDTPDITISFAQIEAVNSMIGLNYSFTDRNDMFNEFIIKFRHSPANGQFLNVLKLNQDVFESTAALENFTGGGQGLKDQCALATGYLGLTDEKKQFVFEAKDIRNQKTAELLLQHFVKWHTNTKAIVKIKTILSESFAWELGEQAVFSDVPGLSNKVKDAQYIITGKRITPNIKGEGPSIEYVLTEVV